MRYPFKNLVFKGGGVLGVAYAGAVEVLEEEGILSRIEQVAGTSAGAIAALLVALRNPPEQMKKIMLELDFAHFTSDSEPLKVQEKYGWFTTGPLHKWIEERIRSSRSQGELSGHETFLDFRDLGCRNLVVFAVDLNTRSVVEFSVKRTPGVRVVDAVLASISIPVFFQSFQFPGNLPNDHIYVDGGALYNYPLPAFDSVRVHKTGRELIPNRETLGLHVEIPGANQTAIDMGFGKIGRWAQQLYDTIKDAQTNYLFTMPAHVERTVFIDTGSVNAIDFKISQEQKEWLVTSGRRSMLTYLRTFRYRNSLRSRIVRSVSRVAHFFRRKKMRPEAGPTSA